MISFPNAKINLGLDVIEKRKDGFHSIQSVFVPITWCDMIEFTLSSETTFSSEGIDIPSKESDNLILKAYKLLAKNHELAPLSIHLEKIIPIGAGLGGGSSDASFMLKMLNDFFELNLNNNELKLLSAELGSDCPFFIENKPCFVEGRGETLTPIDLSLENYEILLINPGIHIGTKEAYAGIRPHKPQKSILDIIKEPISEWKNEGLKNDFETSIFKHNSILSSIKETLYKNSALYASMSGSGSTMFSIFEKGNIPKLDFNDSWMVFKGEFSS